MNKIEKDLSSEKYHSCTEFVSKGHLDWIEQSPAHYAYNIQSPPKETPALTLGKATHAVILERDKIDQVIAVLPDINKRTKAGKEKYEQFVFDNKEKTILTPEEYDRAMRISEAVWSIKLFQNIMKDAETEVSCFVEIDGIKRKSRADIFRKDGILADVKTCQKASIADIQRSIYNFRYHVQSPFYLDNFSEAAGQKYDEFIFIFAEKEEPHGVGFYSASKTMIERGRLDYLRNLETFKECQSRGIWPGYEEKIIEVSLPKWA